jgi:hypothetical protein
VRVPAAIEFYRGITRVLQVQGRYEVLQGCYKGIIRVYWAYAVQVKAAKEFYQGF